MTEDYAQTLERAIAARKQLDPARLFDVRYSQLVEDPIGVVRRIYDHFGYRYDNEFESRMRLWLAENPQGKHGVPGILWISSGLNAQAVRSRFAAYCDYFQVG